MAYTFPKGFTWGASTASHQIEGNTTNDWSEWEKQNAERLAQAAPKKYEHTSPIWNQIKPEATSPANYITGQCDNSYNKTEEDIVLLKELGVTAYRFSIEWSRVEPAKGQFNEEALRHYEQFIDRLVQDGIEPWITILHRAIPLWVARQGGWANKQTVADFGEYTKMLVSRFHSKVDHWMPMNEPVLNIGGGFFSGQIPPGRKNPVAGLKAFSNMARAHNLAYSIIHHVIPGAQVGIPHAAVYSQSYKKQLFAKIVSKAFNYFGNWAFLNQIKNHLDFIGVQYYQTAVLRFKFGGQYGKLFERVDFGGGKNDMGWYIYPQGLHDFCKELWDRYGIPLVITENGIADRNDSQRAKFITDHISKMAEAMQSGITIRGYFHWSLIDNFEWAEGFWPSFGLASVDRKTFKRTLRPSAEVYKKIIKENSVGL
jgi:beta-glucosidase